MTSVAYIAFTFLACLLGLGVGLYLHRLHLKKVAMPEIAGLPDEDATYEALHQWQQRENRSFATYMSCGAVVPVVAALAGWNMRADVVGTLCTGITAVVEKTPLCF